MDHSDGLACYHCVLACVLSVHLFDAVANGDGTATERLCGAYAPAENGLISVHPYGFVYTHRKKQRRQPSRGVLLPHALPTNLENRPLAGLQDAHSRVKRPSVSGGVVKWASCFPRPCRWSKAERARQPRCAHRDTGLDHVIGPERAEGSGVVETGARCFRVDPLARPVRRSGRRGWGTSDQHLVDLRARQRMLCGARRVAAAVGDAAG